MGYIWERKNWNEFTFSSENIEKAYSLYQERKTIADRIFMPMERDYLNKIQAQNLSENIVSSLAIENEKISYDSVYSSIAKKLNLELANHSNNAYSENVSDIVLDAIHNTAALTEQRIKMWHEKLFKNLADPKPSNIGEYRKEAVYIRHISGKLDEITYEAIPFLDVPSEMNKLIYFIKNNHEYNALVKAAIASLWFIIIHPFEDGNGRISRAISDYIISSETKESFRIYSLSSVILNQRNEYYKEISQITEQSESNDITSWLVWNINVATTAIDNAINSFYRTIKISGFISNLDPSIFNSREISMLYKLANKEFFGKLTSSKWAKITKSSQAAAIRDIRHLVKEGYLVPTQEKGSEQGYYFNEDIL